MTRCVNTIGKVEDAFKDCCYDCENCWYSVKMEMRSRRSEGLCHASARHLNAAKLSPQHIQPESSRPTCCLYQQESLTGSTTPPSDQDCEP